MKHLAWKLFLIIVLITGCEKGNDYDLPKKKSLEQTMNKNGDVSINSIQLNSLSNSSEITTAADIFRNIDPVFLQDLIDNNPEGLDSLMQDISNQVLVYLRTKYDSDIDEDVWQVPAENVGIGLYIAAFEIFESQGIQPYSISSNKSGGKISTLMTGDEDFDCFLTAVSGLIGISEVRSIYSDFIHGVSPKTVIRTLKFGLRRVATGISIGIAIYQVGDCLNWW